MNHHKLINPLWGYQWSFEMGFLFSPESLSVVYPEVPWICKKKGLPTQIKILKPLTHEEMFLKNSRKKP